MTPSDSADVVVVGAGIVGTALAAELAPHLTVRVVDAGPKSLAGSTGHAPGFLGEFGGARVATDLATHTTEGLADLALHGRPVLQRTGCLEVATTDAGAEDLLARRGQMRAHGIEAVLLDPADGARLAPETVDPARTTAVLHVPRDAVADAVAATRVLRGRATARGARFSWSTRVTDVLAAASGVIVRSSAGTVSAGHVVLCTGVWSGPLASSLGVALPVVPVRHPYVRGPRDVDPPGPRPFVRIPEHHLYARWHGDRWGFGTYDHAPDPLDADDLERADLAWDGRFDDVVERARRRLARPGLFAPVERLDGVFAVTPDNLPLAGRLVDDAPVWAAAAVWVTHSLGVAASLAAQILGRDAPLTDVHLLDPRRFVDLGPAVARERSLRHYNDIYARG